MIEYYWDDSIDNELKGNLWELINAYIGLRLWWQLRAIEEGLVYGA